MYTIKNKIQKTFFLYHVSYLGYKKATRQVSLVAGQKAKISAKLRFFCLNIKIAFLLLVNKKKLTLCSFDSCARCDVLREIRSDCGILDCIPRFSREEERFKFPELIFSIIFWPRLLNVRFRRDNVVLSFLRLSYT